jgi:hypothetical protein
LLILSVLIVYCGPRGWGRGERGKSQRVGQ